jgi:E3 ubiquitin-protein ligase synoviolin
VTDFVKLGVYAAFFAVLMMFYGLPIHIMRDLFMTTRSFLKRLSALVRYRKALEDMNRYADATEEDLARENTCIICREEMRPWDPSAPGAIERSRPKKLPCGHILHFGCLKSWLERQQACPICRRSVVIDGPAGHGDAAARLNAGGAGQQGPNQGGANNNQARQGRPGGMRMFQLGPLRLGFAQGNAQNIQEMVQRLGGLDGQPAAQPNPAQQGPATAPTTAPTPQPQQGTAPHTSNFNEMHAQLRDIAARLQVELQALQATQAEMQTVYALTTELQRLRQLQQQAQIVAPAGQGETGTGAQPPVPQQPLAYRPLQPFPATPFVQGHFPQLPPRLGSPSIARHTAPSYSTPIPAGSPDLPDGVVIPQGWTLMPLQRVDGQPTPLVPTPTMGQQTEIHNQAQQTSQAVDVGSVLSHNTQPGGSLRGVPSGNPFTGQGPASNDGVVNMLSGPRSAPGDSPPTVSTPDQTQPASVAAPTPVTPSLERATQRVANDESKPSPTASSSTEEQVQGHAKSSSTGEVDGEHQTSETSDKGKARAATVEDAEDAEDE